MTSSAQNLTTEVLTDLPVTVVYGCDTATGMALCKELISLDCMVYGIPHDDNPINLINAEKRYVQLNKNETSNISVKIDYIFYLAEIHNPVKEETGVSYPTVFCELALKNKAKFQLIQTLFTLPADRMTAHCTFEELIKIPLFEHETDLFKTLYFYRKEKNLNCRIVRPLYLYGPGIEEETENQVEQMIVSVITDKQLKINTDDSEEIYPLYLTDAAALMVKNIFIPAAEGKLIYLISDEKITIRDFAAVIQKIVPQIPVIKTATDTMRLSALTAKPFFPQSEKTDFINGIIKTLEYLNTYRSKIIAGHIVINQQINNNEPSVNSTRAFKPPVISFKFKLPRVSFSFKKKTMAIILFILFMIILAAGTPGIFIFYRLNLIKQKTASVLSSLSGQNINSLNIYLNETESSLKEVKKLFNLYGFPLTALQKGDKYKNTVKLLDTAIEGLEGLQSLADSGKSYESVLSSFFSSDSVSGSGLRMALAREGLIRADEQLALTKTRLSTLDFANIFFLEKYREKIVNAIRQFENYRTQLSRLREISAVLPEIIGLNGKRTYLILFNNNYELRPGGGFIGSYGLLTLNQGKLADLKIDDVYNADGQLTGHVEPPRPIRKYLEQPHWYLRDSNWSPDFFESAERAEWFLEKETGRKVDGTIFVDLNVIRALLTITGPVNLSDYQETINADNLFAKATYYSQDNFFPGSTQKKDFLSTLSQTLLSKIISSPSNIMLPFLISAPNLIDEKHLALFFHDEATQNMITRFNWGGRMGSELCRGEEGCQSDYLMPVEANLGVNKANYFIQRIMKQKILLSDNYYSSSELEISYQNNSTKETKTEGTYKNYLRIFLPQNSEINKITEDGNEVKFNIISPLSEITDKPQEKKSVKTDSLEVTREEQLDKTSYGFLISIPPETKKTVTVSYLQPVQIATDRKNSYKLLVQKQMGEQNDNYYFEIYFPDKLTVTGFPKETVITKGKITYNGKLDKDKIFNFIFQPNTSR